VQTTLLRTFLKALPAAVAELVEHLDTDIKIEGLNLAAFWHTEITPMY
jgi:hypothetical protein